MSETIISRVSRIIPSAARALQVAAVAAVLAVAAGPVAPAQAQTQFDPEAVKTANSQYRDVSVAMRDGYEAFMDCFNNPGVGAMGYHYLNKSLLDLTPEMLKPEAMVYEADANGQLHLVAVEYIVPAADWDAQSSELPSLLGMNFHLNEKLGVYVLHAWLWKDNPTGMFEDWNPTVSCSYLPAAIGAVGMPSTGSGDAVPAGLVSVAALTVLLLSAGVWTRRRSLRSS